MPLFDTWQTVPDTAQLSAGQSIKFEITSQCVPLATPSPSDISGAFAANAPSMSVESVESGSYQLGAVISDAFLPGYVNMVVRATAREVISVGNLKAQIISSFVGIGSAVSCRDWTIRNDQMDILTARAQSPLDPSGAPNLTLGLIALIGIIGILIWRDVREVVAPI